MFSFNDGTLKVFGKVESECQSVDLTKSQARQLIYQLQQFVESEDILDCDVCKCSYKESELKNGICLDCHLKGIKLRKL